MKRSESVTTELVDDARPGPGRPRDARIDERIREATLELLETEGYQATTIQAIARRASVGAPTIYRRWPTKAALIEFAILPDMNVVVPESTHDTAAGMRCWADALLQVVQQTGARKAMPGLMLEYIQDPQAWEHMFATERAPMRDAFFAFIDDAVRQGTVRKEVDASVVFETLLGAVIFRAIVSGAEDLDSFADSVAQLILDAILLPPSPRRRRHR
jgi:AcrR family transcriptional regulator